MTVNTPKKGLVALKKYIYIYKNRFLIKNKKEKRKEKKEKKNKGNKRKIENYAIIEKKTKKIKEKV
jgi:hypothetical protein